METFSWHKTLNIKKVIIVALIILLLIIFIFFAFFKKDDDKITAVENYSNPSSPNSIFYDKDKTISLELSKLYNLEQYTPTENYLIELRSENNLNVFVSFKENIAGKELKNVVSADKRAFTEAFEKTSNISELKELNVNGNPAYTYSFHYLDQNLNQAFYIQIVWILIDNNYYIFDIEFPLDKINNYANIVTDTLALFKKI